jgi:hypothetical protein
MSSILKVDTIQDQSGNNIINESGNVITIGASGDTITVPAGATVSGFTSAGIDDNATSVAITIDSDEKVGIGTTSPSFEFEVKDASGAAVIRVNNGGDNRLVDLIADSTGGLLRTVGSYPLVLNTNQTERMRILADGKVGIGTTTPTVPLEVNGAVKFNEASGVSSGTVIIDGTATGNPQLRFYQNGTAKAYLTYWDSSDTLALTDGSASGLHFSPSTQRVGIGTSSPATTLHVSGGTANTVSLIESTDAYAWLSMKDNSSANSYINSIGASGDNLQIISKDITFRTASAPNVSTGTYGTERMRIDSSGNVGIGTSSPSVKLDVKATSFTPDNTNTSLLVEAPAVFSQAQHFYIYNAGVYNSSRPTGGIGAVNSSNLITLTAGSIVTGNPGADGFKAYSTNSSLYDIGNAEHTFSTKTGLTVGNQFTHTKRVKIFNNGVTAFNDGIALGVGINNTASNVLDDYEEGTWTASLSGTTGAPSGVNYSSRTGRYTKIGRLVEASVYLALSSWTSAPSGNALVSGLPFTVDNVTNVYFSAIVGWCSNFDSDNAPKGGWGEANSSTIRLIKANSTSARDNFSNNVSASALNGNEQLIITIVYETA